MRVIVVGLGVQGKKRRAVAGLDVVATVDPVNKDADYADVGAVAFDRFDAALLCVPDEAKLELIEPLLLAGKHILVEKPLVVPGGVKALSRLAEFAHRNGALLYTAYNHRFEPHFVRMRNLLASGVLGRVYAVRMFYGNGTARLVRESAWRDQGTGVLPDLGSHLLDTVRFWLGDTGQAFALTSANAFENRSFDHIAFGAQAKGEAPLVQLEMTLLSWRNHFYADVFAEKGSAHISSLCKWGPSTFTHRSRVLPSGRPDEESVTLIEADPTWELEYSHFKALCESADPAAGGNTGTDIWIHDTLEGVGRQALAHTGSQRKS